MTQEQFDREKKYRAAIELAKKMLAAGIITVDDFDEVEARFMEIYQPVMAI